jgi:multiple sugar transport system substrate-binding protein
MTRRQLLQAVGAAAGVTALAGCSDAAARWGFSGNADKSKVHLTYALWDGFQQVGYQKSVDEFTAANPIISVTIQQIPYNSYQPKITSAYISGNAPDLFWVNTPFLANWISQGLVTDITDRIKADNVDLSIYYPSLVELHQRHGRTYGLPKDWDTITFYFNRTMFKKLGVQPPQELTWNPDGSGSLVPFLKRITVDGNGKTADQSGFDKGNITTYALGVPNDPQSGYGSWLPANGGNIVPHPYADHLVLDSAQNQKTFAFLLQHLAEENVLMPPQEMGPNGNGDNAQVLFAQGRMALYMTGDWNTNALSQLGTGFEIGTIRLPAGPQGNYSVFNGLTDAINTATPHPDEAWKLAKWLGGERSQTIMGSGGYIWPAIKKLDPLFLNYWKKKNVDVAAFLDAAHGKTVLYPVTLGMGEAVQDFATQLGPMFFGTKPIAQALSDAQAVGDYRITSTAQ